MDMTAENIFNKKFKFHMDKKIIIHMIEEYASIKTKELEKQLQKEAMKQLSLLDQIKELEEENKYWKDESIRLGIRINELVKQKRNLEDQLSNQIEKKIIKTDFRG